MCKLLQTEQLVSPVGVISSEAHPFVTHSSVCPSPLSPTSGPIMSPLHTWLYVLLSLTSRLLWMGAPIETELDK